MVLHRGLAYSKAVFLLFPGHAMDGPETVATFDDGLRFRLQLVLSR